MCPLLLSPDCRTGEGAARRRRRPWVAVWAREWLGGEGKGRGDSRWVDSPTQFERGWPVEVWPWWRAAGGGWHVRRWHCRA